MIKLSKIEDETMDKIMDIVRETNYRPDQVIKIMLKTVNFNEAMRAVKYDKEVREIRTKEV